jgi:tetratricopeptide (TPR) repeat protein
MTGAHLWADRFDGGLEDIFDLQDQVTSSVVGAIAPKLEQAEIERAARKPTENLDAYDYYLRGVAALHQVTHEANDEALRLFRRAIELDPKFASAYGMAARCYDQRKLCGWVTDRERDVAETRQLARRAAELGRDDAVALCTAGFSLAYVAGELENGAKLIERALVLNPNLAWGWLYSGWVQVWFGNAEAGIERLKRTMRLSPQDPQIGSMYAGIAYGHFVAGRYAEAIAAAETAILERPEHNSALRILAASCAILGDQVRAEKAMGRLRELDPALRVSNLRYLIPLRRPDDYNRLADGLRKAGLPE